MVHATGWADNPSTPPVRRRTRRIGTQMTSTAKRCAVLVLLAVMAVGVDLLGLGVSADLN